MFGVLPDSKMGSLSQKAQISSLQIRVIPGDKEN